MKFENCLVSNFENAFRGMRNPKNSWDRSDSYFGIGFVDTIDYGLNETAINWIKYEHPNVKEFSKEYDELLDHYCKDLVNKGAIRKSDTGDVVEVAFIGPNDMKLARQLVKAGTPHDKFLRQIFVSVDITAPLYWWKEMDTYKVATVANSTSTMHKLTSNPITLDCFETDDFVNIGYPKDAQRPELKSNIDEDFVQMCLIPYLEYLRQTYISMSKDNPEEAKKYWKELVRWLPEGWLQTRTWTANYATLRGIYKWRKDHKLKEWHQFCKFIEILPYAKELIME